MEQGREPAGAACCSFSGCVSLRGERSGGNVSPKRLIYYRFVVSCSMSYRSPPAPATPPIPFSSESKRSGCPINLVNLCRMRAKCQQTKSQLAERPHNSPSPLSLPDLFLLQLLLGCLPKRMLCAYQTLLAKWKTPKCKTQNANAKAKARAKARAKASADSCAIQSCCLCQVASSLSL